MRLIIPFGHKSHELLSQVIQRSEFHVPHSLDGLLRCQQLLTSQKTKPGLNLQHTASNSVQSGFYLFSRIRLVKGIDKTSDVVG